MNNSKSSKAFSRLGLIVAGVIMGYAVESKAVPVLQVYVEGATYDATTETWVGDFDAGGTVRLWTIGNVDGNGGKGTIYDVKLAVAYSSADTPTISLVSSTTGGFGGFTDPSLANTATFLQTVTDGSTPLLGDGSSLASHGIYGAGTSWQEFGLGDFSKTDALGGDFITALPSPPSGGYDINVYEVTVTGTGLVHFDLYNHTESATSGQVKYWFAPFSHDGEAGGNGVPDGGSTLALLGLALVGFGVAMRKLEFKAN